MIRNKLYTKQPNRIFRLLAKSVGEKSGKDTKESDKIACIRLSFAVLCVITNLFIISGVIRHW